MAKLTQLPALPMTRRLVEQKAKRDGQTLYGALAELVIAGAVAKELMAKPEAMNTLRAAKAGKLKYKALDLNDENFGL